MIANPALSLAAHAPVFPRSRRSSRLEIVAPGASYSIGIVTPDHELIGSGLETVIAPTGAELVANNQIQATTTLKLTGW